MKKTIYSEAQEALCTALLQARKKAGLTQTVLAKRLERPQSFVAKVEGGERRLDVVEFVQYAHALDIGIVRLLERITSSGRSRG